MTEKKADIPNNSADRLAGMLIGILCSDAIGSQFEFDNSLTYHDKLEYRLSVYYKRTHTRKYGVLGQYSDDSEMTLVLLRHILSKGGYDSKEVALNYMEWANSGTFLGRNTRALFKGVKTWDGYVSRYKKQFVSQSDIDSSQSNGFLMRASPLVLLPDQYREQAVRADCALTNPSPVAIATNIAYIRALRALVEGKTVNQAIEAALKDAPIEVSSVIKDAIDDKKSRDLSGKSKGWCLHALFAAFRCLYFAPSLMSTLRWICDQKNTDTDTLAAIAGSLVSAKLGYENLLKESGLPEIMKTVLTVDTTKGQFPRAEKWLLRVDQFTTMVPAMTAMFSGVYKTQQPTAEKKAPETGLVYGSLKDLLERLRDPVDNIIISGDRNWQDEKIMKYVLCQLPSDTRITHGACRGADLMFASLALERNTTHATGFQIVGQEANWKMYGKGAGPKRNQEMLDSCAQDMVIAFHDNIQDSKGTKNMIMLANKAKVPCYLISSRDLALLQQTRKADSS